MIFLDFLLPLAFDGLIGVLRGSLAGGAQGLLDCMVAGRFDGLFPLVGIRSPFFKCGGSWVELAAFFGKLGNCSVLACGFARAEEDEDRMGELG